VIDMLVVRRKKESMNHVLCVGGDERVREKLSHLDFMAYRLSTKAGYKLNPPTYKHTNYI
jgi:hypothetical protein